MHLSAHTWMRAEPLDTTLARLSSLGYDSVELAGEPEQYPIDNTLALLQKYDLKCWGTVTIQKGRRNLIAADAQQRRDTIEYMKDVINLSAGLGGKIVTIVPGNVGTIISHSSPEDEWVWAVEGLREVAEFANHKGIKVGIEALNRFETHFINRSDQAIALADEVGYNVGIAFDPFHIAIEEVDLISAIYSCRSRIIDFHVGDSNRLAPGSGSFDWPKIIAALVEAGYDGGLAVEFMPPIDRTPIGNYGKSQLEDGKIEVNEEDLKFIIDHGSGLLSDAYYTKLLSESAQKLAPFV